MLLSVCLVLLHKHNLRCVSLSFTTESEELLPKGCWGPLQILWAEGELIGGTEESRELEGLLEGLVLAKDLLLELLLLLEDLLLCFLDRLLGGPGCSLSGTPAFLQSPSGVLQGGISLRLQLTIRVLNVADLDVLPVSVQISAFSFDSTVRLSDLTLRRPTPEA